MNFDQYGFGIAMSFLNQLDLIRDEAVISEVARTIADRATDAQIETLRAVTP